MGHVVIGMDPHKRSARIGIIDDRQKVLVLCNRADTPRAFQPLAGD
jgi:hypothetical protein